MFHPLFDLTGRVALVTGAGGGFGGAISEGFAEAGADLLITDINPDTLRRTAETVTRLGRRAVPVVGDATDPQAIRTIYDRLDQEYGRIDVLVTCAGPAWTTRPEELSLDDLDRTLKSLGVGKFCFCQEAGRRMLAQGKGSIINIGSIASVSALGRGHVAYGMGMAAVVEMTRELSTEWSGRGVRVNAILPAQVPNENNGLVDRMQASPALRDTFLRGIPMGRLGRSEEIKGPAVFLASDASSWVTGIILPMDGGNLAKNAGGSHPGMPGETASL
ncbi:MAG: SDR family oxidoreductase [Chloroflexi bacterium]|nr:SDR family oxidoreductase [Chloroflexota bacterium]MCL5274672.1 SDR family oxidoreductase [Chloroflexota bacterium]